MIADIHITEKSFGSASLYKNLRFSIQKGEKVGVIGRNGVGKSTLFGIMTGADADFSGEVAYRSGLVVASTRQEHHDVEDRTVLDYILHDLPEYAALKHIIDTYPDQMGDDMAKITRYSEALERFESLGYYQVEESIVRELGNFQIDETKARALLRNLSGGQKRLAEVVKIMHSGAQLALVDEPTNHMDYVAKQQFIDWLDRAREAVLVITHDRDVLAGVDRIIEIKDGQALSFPGNYDAYLRQNTLSTTTKLHDYEVTQRQISNVKKRIEYAKSKKASWGGTADKKNPFVVMENKARRELADLQKIEKPSFWIDRDSAAELNYKVEENYQKYKARNIRMKVSTAESKSSRLLVSARELSLGYQTPLFAGVSFDLREKQRLELRGRNGAGKTTLIKALLARRDMAHSDAQILNGELNVDATMAIGVYEQEVEGRYFDLGLAEAIEQLYVDQNVPITREKVMRLMSDYLFDPVLDATTPVRKLSGGQKARFQIISMLSSDPQLLILDEPTNHLDLPSIEELETALEKFAGAVMFVSHDSYFRDKVGGEVLPIGAD